MLGQLAVSRKVLFPVCYIRKGHYKGFTYKEPKAPCFGPLTSQDLHVFLGHHISWLSWCLHLGALTGY